MQVNTGWEDARLLDEESQRPLKRTRGRFRDAFERTFYTEDYGYDQLGEIEGELSESEESEEELDPIIRYPSIFDDIPDEILLRIWTFLDPQSIGRAAQSCRR